MYNNLINICVYVLYFAFSCNRTLDYRDTGKTVAQFVLEVRTVKENTDISVLIYYAVFCYTSLSGRVQTTHRTETPGNKHTNVRAR